MIPIKEYEVQYTIAENGDVTRRETGRILRPSLNKQTGYLYVGLWKHNIGKTFAVHRLVAEHYISNPANKPFVNHKDSIRTNPHKDNLEWCTQGENILHGYAQGFMSQENRRNFKDFELDLLLQSVLAGETMTTLASAADVGLGRLTINLRKYADTAGLLEKFLEELYRQKCERNAQANVNKRRPILQWTIQGTLVSEHESATAAARTLGRSSAGSIFNALNPGKTQQKAFGYLWTFK